MHCTHCGSTLAYNPHTGAYFAIAWHPVTLAHRCATHPHVPAN